jgi:hypothetical protein
MAAHAHQGKGLTVTLPDGQEIHANSATNILLSRLLATSEEQAKTMVQVKTTSEAQVRAIDAMAGKIDAMSHELSEYGKGHGVLEQRVVSLERDREQQGHTLYGSDGTGGLVKGHTRSMLALGLMGGVLLATIPPILVVMVKALVSLAASKGMF